MQKWVEKTKDFSTHTLGCGKGICFSRASRKTVHRTVFLPNGKYAHSGLAPNSNPLPSDSATKKYSSKTAAVFCVVAGRGFEPPDLWVMSPTS